MGPPDGTPRMPVSIRNISLHRNPVFGGVSMFDVCFGMHWISGSREPKTRHALRDFQNYWINRINIEYYNIQYWSCLFCIFFACICCQNLIFALALLMPVDALELPQLNQSWFLLELAFWQNTETTDRWRSALARTWHSASAWWPVASGPSKYHQSSNTGFHHWRPKQTSKYREMSDMSFPYFGIVFFSGTGHPCFF